MQPPSNNPLLPPLERVKSLAVPSRERPLPLWMLLPVFFVGIYLSHWTLLRLPYYWDEAGYYVPAAWDFFRTGALIPYSTLTNAHPPLPSILLALCWRFGGMVPSVTRTAMCMVSAIALLAVYRLGIELTGRPQSAVVTVLLTAIYPVWFAQSTLAHADLFAAAATLWALSYYFEDTPRSRIYAGICFTLAALSKETAIATPLALAIYESVIAYKIRRQPNPKPILQQRLLPLLAPVLPLAAWYAYHRYKTGYFFGNPGFLRYNATATLTPLRIVLAFGHRLLHLTAHMNLFVTVLCMFAAMFLLPLPEPRDGVERPHVPYAAQGRIYAIFLANLLLFSVLGGALLTRYLLPLYPILILLCVNTWRRRVRYWLALVALSAAAFLAALVFNPPYRFAPEDNLAYAEVVRLHQQAIAQLVQKYPSATVLTAWPVSDELTRPELGYVRKPLSIVKIDNFSLAQIQAAASLTQPYTVALVFSTKYDPPNLPFSLGPRNEALDTRYFDFHHDLPPEAIARMLNGEVVWQTQRNGQWAALLHVNRPQFASLTSPD